MRNRGRAQEAIPILRELVAENPLNAHALDFLAASLATEKRFAEAVPVLERLLEIGRESRSARFNLATCLEQSGKPRQAVPHYERAVELDPTHVPSLRRLVSLHADRPRKAAVYRRMLRELR